MAAGQPGPEQYGLRFHWYGSWAFDMILLHVKGQGQKRSHTPRLSSEEPGMDCSNAVEFCKKPPNARQPDNARCCRALQIIQDLYADDYALARRYGIRMPSDRDHGFFGDFT